MEETAEKTSTWLALRNPVFKRLWLAMVISGSCIGAHSTAVWADRFQKVQFSNNIATPDEHSPHISADGKLMWATGSWSATIKGKDWGPKDIKGYWSVIREGDDWKIRMLTSNVTPEPAK